MVRAPERFEAEVLDRAVDAPPEVPAQAILPPAITPSRMPSSSADRFRSRVARRSARGRRHASRSCGHACEGSGSVLLERSAGPCYGGVGRMAHSSSGPGHRPLKAEIAGSNPACATNETKASERSACSGAWQLWPCCGHPHSEGSGSLRRVLRLCKHVPRSQEAVVGPLLCVSELLTLFEGFCQIGGRVGVASTSR